MVVFVDDFVRFGKQREGVVVVFVDDFVRFGKEKFSPFLFG